MSFFSDIDIGCWLFFCPAESRFHRVLLDFFYYRAKAIWYGCARVSFFLLFISMFRLCRLECVAKLEPIERVSELGIDTKCILKQQQKIDTFMENLLPFCIFDWLKGKYCNWNSYQQQQQQPKKNPSIWIYMVNPFYRWIHFRVVIVYKIYVTKDVKCEIYFNNSNRIHSHKIMGIKKFARKNRGRNEEKKMLM